MRVTGPLIKVLGVLLAGPGAELYGLEILLQARLKSGTVYPLLDRLEGAGWVESRWEKAEPTEEGRPRRRFYRLTALGAHEARQLLLDHGFGVTPWSA